MSQFLCCLFVALSFVQLTIQSTTSNPYSPDRIELILIVHRNESGQYVVERRLTTSPGSLSYNNTLIMKTDLSESGGQIILKFEGIFAVTDYLRRKSTFDVMTDVPESAGQTTNNLQEITSVPTKEVPEDYEYFPGVGHYKFYPALGKPYNESIETCSNDGAHLAIVNSEAEMQTLRNILASQSNRFDYAYLGFFYQREEGRFVTIFGDALRETGYEIWHKGEPDKTAGWDCGGMYRDGGLGDLICAESSTVGFFCELNP